MTTIARYLLSLTALSALGLIAAAATEPAELIFAADFDHYDSSRRYQKTDFLHDWHSPQWENGVKQGRVTIAPNTRNSDRTNQCLAITYPTGKIGSTESGAQWKVKFTKGFEAAELSYRVKFADDFDFVRGGKLPGLASGSAPSGTRTMEAADGWSARLMWRERGTAIAYTQHLSSGKKADGSEEDKDYWKTSSGERFTFQPGRWYQISQRIRLNRPGQKDGTLQIAIDGQLLLSRNDIPYRRTADLQIDQLFFSTFFGGSNRSWAASKDETIYFDDFMITAVQQRP